ncbi:MAG: VOC family protein [Bacteroidales bacterium]|nr:VOC family protein [Bacteroidales bacterium]
MKENYLISGIQQIGVGCTRFEESWKWYIDMFGMDVRILEDDTVAERMLPYTGGQPHRRHACIAVNLQGGGGFEIWQYSDRTPTPCDFEVAAGDLGIFAAKLKCKDVKAFHHELQQKKQTDNHDWLLGDVVSTPEGTPAFTLRDPWGNYFYVEHRTDVFIEQHRLNGGISGAMVGSTDADRSLPFYRDLLGYDTVVYDRTDTFADLATFNGGNGRFRRIKLRHSAPRRGAFAPLLGPSTIEILQPIDRTPRKIYEGRLWGDPGFIQLCFDVTNMRALEQRCNELGHPFTVDSCRDNGHFDMGEASGHFTYIEDPDGTLVELVEAHKLTVLKRPHIYINMLNRDREKAFPKLFFRLMGLSKVKL